jgi:hypothetical protein
MFLEEEGDEPVGEPQKTNTWGHLLGSRHSPFVPLTNA